MHILNKKEVYNLKTQIEEVIKSHEVFMFGRDTILKELSIQYGMFFLVNAKTDEIPYIKNKYFNFELDKGMNEKFLQESFKWCIKWAHEFCDEEGKNGRPKFDKIQDLFTLAFAYEIFFNTWYGNNKGRYEVSENKEYIKFKTLNDNVGTFQLYNNYRQFKRNQNIISRLNDKYPHDEVINSDFYMDDEWDIGGYTLGEYKEFNKFLSNNILTKITKMSTISRESLKSFNTIKEKNNWIAFIKNGTTLTEKVINSILNDLIYDRELNNTDISYQYFIPMGGDSLMLPELFFFGIRPERNLLSLIPKIKSDIFSHISNECEEIQKQHIQSEVFLKNILYSEGVTKEQKLRPGMDLLILNINTFKLLVCELKWNIPVSNSKELLELDRKVSKGIGQTNSANKYVEDNKNTILEEYFGSKYKGISPIKHECLVVTHESIGTGYELPSNCKVITVDHLIELLNQGGVDNVIFKLKNPHSIDNIEVVESEVKLRIGDKTISVPMYNSRNIN